MFDFEKPNKDRGVQCSREPNNLDGTGYLDRPAGRKGGLKKGDPLENQTEQSQPEKREASPKRAKKPLGEVKGKIDCWCVTEEKTSRYDQC